MSNATLTNQIVLADHRKISHLQVIRDRDVNSICSYYLDHHDCLDRYEYNEEYDEIQLVENVLPKSNRVAVYGWSLDWNDSLPTEAEIIADLKIRGLYQDDLQIFINHDGAYLVDVSAEFLFNLVKDYGHLGYMDTFTTEICGYTLEYCCYSNMLTLSNYDHYSDVEILMEDGDTEEQAIALSNESLINFVSTETGLNITSVEHEVVTTAIWRYPEVYFTIG